MSIGYSTKPLTDVAIKRMKPESLLVDNGQYGGLRVERGKSGRTSFIYRYRSPIDGKLKQVKVGSYPEMKLSQARLEFERLRSLRDSGVCVASARKLEKAAVNETKVRIEQAERDKEVTVSRVVEHYLANYIEDRRGTDGRKIAGARKLKGQREVRNLLLGNTNRVLRRDGRANSPMLLQLLGDVSVLMLNHKDVVEAITAVVDRGANVSAGNMLREFTAAVDYSIGDLLPDDYVNPCYQAKAILQRRKISLNSKSRKRYLTDSELEVFMDWLPASRYTPAQKNVLLFTLMTGCRTGEVVQAEWTDMDFARGVWHLRENKTDSPRNVQLSTQSLAMLEQLRRVTGKHLFPSQKTGLPIQQKSLTEQAWHLRRDGHMVDLEPWVPHDLRRSVRTGLARLGCPSEVAEAILGHAKSGMEGVYNLHQYESEARHWLQKWNDHLDGLSMKEGRFDD